MANRTSTTEASNSFSQIIPERMHQRSRSGLSEPTCWMQQKLFDRQSPFLAIDFLGHNKNANNFLKNSIVKLGSNGTSSAKRMIVSIIQPSMSCLNHRQTNGCAIAELKISNSGFNKVPSRDLRLVLRSGQTGSAIAGRIRFMFLI